MGLTDNFDKLEKDRKPDSASKETSFHEENPFRKLCFVQPNKERLSLSYGRLRASVYSPDEGCITLTYETHTVTLKGYNLEPVFDAIDTCKVKELTCIEKRYEEIAREKGGSFITEILAVDQTRH